MAGRALRHFVEEAIGRHADELDDWFPGCFHWRGLLADTPAMSAQLGGYEADPTDLEGNEAIRQRASHVFRFGHVATLAVLAAGSQEDGNPVETLDLLVTEPDEGEERYFGELVDEVLGPLETFFTEDGAPLDPRGEAAYELVSAAWPVVHDLLQEDGVLGQETQPFPGDTEDRRHAVGTVLAGIARVSAILAAFRWLSVGRAA